MEGQQQEHEVNNNVKDKVEEEVIKVGDDSGGKRRVEEEERRTVVQGPEVEEERRIVVQGPEEWLCVARLPLDMDEEEFQDLLAEFGRVEEAFLVRSRRTGEFSISIIPFGQLINGLKLSRDGL